MKPLSIRVKLVVASVLTVVVAMTTLTLSNISSARRAAEAIVQDQIKALIDSNSRTLAQWTASKMEVLSALAVSVQHAEPQAALLQAQAAGGFQLTYIGWPDKRFLFSQPTEIPSDWDPTSRPWYQDAAQAGETVLTSPYINTQDGELVLSASSPAIRDGRVVAVVSADINMNAIVSTVHAMKLSPNSFGVLVNGEGEMIAAPDPKLAMQPIAELLPGYDVTTVQRMAKQGGGNVMLGENEYWVSGHGIPNTNWMLLAVVSQEDAFAGVNTMARNAALMSGLMVLLAAAVLTFLTTTLLRRLGQLRDALKDIASGEGDLTRRLDASGQDELSHVGTYFNQFVDKLASTLHRIKLTTGSLHMAVAEVSAGNQDLSSRTEQTASNLQETAGSMEQLTGTVQQTAESANSAGALARDAQGPTLSHGR